MVELFILISSMTGLVSHTRPVSRPIPLGWATKVSHCARCDGTLKSGSHFMCVHRCEKRVLTHVSVRSWTLHPCHWIFQPPPCSIRLKLTPSTLRQCCHEQAGMAEIHPLPGDGRFSSSDTRGIDLGPTSPATIRSPSLTSGTALDCPCVQGHINPLVSLVPELEALGYECGVVSCDGAAEMVAKRLPPSARLLALGPSDRLHAETTAAVNTIFPHLSLISYNRAICTVLCS